MQQGGSALQRLGIGEAVRAERCQSFVRRRACRRQHAEHCCSLTLSVSADRTRAEYSDSTSHYGTTLHPPRTLIARLPAALTVPNRLFRTAAVFRPDGEVLGYFGRVFGNRVDHSAKRRFNMHIPRQVGAYTRARAVTPIRARTRTEACTHLSTHARTVAHAHAHTCAQWRPESRLARAPKQASAQASVHAYDPGSSASGALSAQRLRRLLFDAVAPGTVQWAKKLVRIDGMADDAGDGAQSLDTLFLDWPEAPSVLEAYGGLVPSGTCHDTTRVAHENRMACAPRRVPSHAAPP